LNHLEAKQTILRALLFLSDAQRLVVQGISLLETGYANWGPDPLKGAGSNNMGAITDGSYRQGQPADSTQFLHQDHRPATAQEIASGDFIILHGDKVKVYTTAFKKYPSPEEGFADVARVALKPNVNAAIVANDLYGVSSAMFANHYYTGSSPTAKQNIDAHDRALSNAIHSIISATGDINPFAKGGSGSPALPLPSVFFPSGSWPVSSILPSILRLGSRGLYVKAWQEKVGVRDDGEFGPKTVSATKAWQVANGLNPDGVVGPLTWEKAHEKV
jgi:peptidoglycan hydrolase-like protein with peptidoglycan-binding domain